MVSHRPWPLGVDYCLPFRVLDPTPEIFDRVSALYFEGDHPARARPYEDLHG